MNILTRIINKASRIIDSKVLYKRHQKRINNTDFSIISNNCWGGVIYEFFGLQKNSPTVGCYFFAKDYIKFIGDLKKYCSMQIKMISAAESKHYDILHAIGQDDIPIGQLGDVEVVFLHYKTPELAKSKWERRCQRINWDNIIIKFSYMSLCDDDCVREFQKIEGKKVMFVSKHFDNMNNLVFIPSAIGNENDVGNDIYSWKHRFDIYEFINKAPFSMNSKAD